MLDADPNQKTVDLREISKPLLVVGLVFTLLLAAYLRFIAVHETVNQHPYRSDVVQYYNTAFNLNRFGVYSHTIVSQDGKESAPLPDAFVTPGYPLFLSLFVDGPPEQSIFQSAERMQALLGVMAVALVFLLFALNGNPWIGMSAAVLTAISPHLVNATVLLLSETLFSVLLLATLIVYALHLRGPKWFKPALAACGLLLGMAALTRPILEFFPVVLIALLFLRYPPRQALRGGGLLLAGFILVWSPWVIRNYASIGKAGDSAVMISTLSSGMYPDFEYEHDPRTLGEPYRYDPHTAEINSSLGSALHAIAGRFQQHPAEELKWYLLDKPVTLWSWDIVEGGGDAYIYPLLRSPYMYSAPFVVTHNLMFWIHWPLVLLAFVTCVLVWLPYSSRLLGDEPRMLAQLVAALLFYNTAMLMVLAPYVRYSIPFLPLQYAMASFAVLLLFRWFRSRERSAAQPA